MQVEKETGKQRLVHKMDRGMRIKDTLHALTVNLYSPTVQLQVNFPQIDLLCHSESRGPVHTSVLRNLSLRVKHLSFQVDSRVKTFSCSSAFPAAPLSPSRAFRSHPNPLNELFHGARTVRGRLSASHLVALGLY